jgi:hypothetical protein
LVPIRKGRCHSCEFAKVQDEESNVGTNVEHGISRCGHVYVFEPDPRPVEYLKASLAASEMDWVR